MSYNWSAAQLSLSPSSTPGLMQLTALQELEVSKVGRFDADLLSSMPRLQRLVLRHLQLADEDAGLSVLNQLTCLQHLAISLPHAAIEQAPALTASSQLTFLDISNNLVLQPGYEHMFPAGRQLPQLRELRATMALLGSCPVVDEFVRCCPALEVLHLGSAADQEVDDTFYAFDGTYNSVALLGNLKSLTSLTLDLQVLISVCLLMIISTW